MLKDIPYWWDDAAPLPNLMTRPLPNKADVVVIGSGYTGLSAARVLALRGAHVVVLEKETFGWGASSRNGGQVLTGLKLGPSALIQAVGLARAKELFAHSLASIQYLEDLITEENIACEYTRAGHIEAAWKNSHFKQYQHEQVVLAREFNHPVTLLERARQQDELGTSYYHGLLIDERSGALHPAQFVRGLAICASGSGALLFEKTPATHILRDGNGYAVVTPHGTLKAENVLIATNGYTDEAAPELRKRVFPLGSYIIATEPLPSDLAAKLIPQRRVVFDSKHYLYYFRLSSDNRLLFGGRADYQPPTPEANRKSAEILRRGMVQVFPDLKDAAIEYAWSGNICLTRDFFPRAGRHDGLYYALGYGGHGVAMATYLGGQLANIICGAPGRNPFHDLPFEPLPFYYGRPFMPLGALYYKLLDVISQRPAKSLHSRTNKDSLVAYRRIVLTVLATGLFLTAFLLSISKAAPAATPIEPLPPGVFIETVVPSANQLVAMDFTPDGRLLYTERFSDYQNGTYRGYVRVVVNGQLRPDPVYAFPIVKEGEQGLLGIAVDPNFAINHYVWVYFTKNSGPSQCSGVTNRVVRFTLNDDNTVSGDPLVAHCFPVYQPVPGYAVTIHNGANLHFGPDGKLYIGVGNNNEKTTDPSEPAQDLALALGKMHRFDATVPLSVPADNPFTNLPGADKSNYAYGLRNPFDFTFDPVSGQLFATDNGDECDDEINLIRAGYNYGWRLNYPQTPLPCDDDVGPDPRYNTIAPLFHWTPSIAPTGITFYQGNLIPEWKNDLFMCAFKDEATALHHFKLNATRTAIISHTIIAGTQCRTDVLTGPDGALYYSEGGGYYNGPLKRLSRTTSFTPSSVSVNPPTARTGEVFAYLLRVSHAGTLSNTFHLTATLSPSTTVESLSPGLQDNAGVVTWSGVLTGIQSITGTIAVRVTDPVTTPYFLTIPIEITAPQLPAVNLSATVLINGFPIFLPLIHR